MEKILLVSTGVRPSTATNPVNLPEGAVQVFNARTGAPLSAGDTIDDAPEIFVARGVAAGAQPVVSPVIRGVDVRDWFGKAYAAPARHQLTIGYAGSGTGTIAPVNSGEYDLIVKELSQGFEPYPTISKSIIAGLVATPHAIADSLAALVNADPNKRMVAEVLADVTTVALDNTVTLTTTNGSDIVVGSGSNHGVVAGAALRIGHATTKTLPVYIVAAVDGANIRLTRPYWKAGQTQGAVTAAVAAGDGTVGAASDEAGLQLTATDFGYVLAASLDGELYGAGITVTTAFVNGTGRGVQVLKAEQNEQGKQAFHNRVWLVQPTLTQTDSAKNYVSYHLKYANTQESAAMPTTVDTNEMLLQIYVDTTATNAKGDLEAILNPWVASCPAGSAAVTL